MDQELKRQLIEFLEHVQRQFKGEIDDNPEATDVKIKRLLTRLQTEEFDNGH